MEAKAASSATYCVTGATGYIGSWLVKSLLQRGFKVHAPVRDPEKGLNLLKKLDGGDRLRLFKADLHEEGSFDEAVRGCHGVFHVAANMQFHVPDEDNLVRYKSDEKNMALVMFKFAELTLNVIENVIEDYVQENVIEPAVKGTLNLLKSCLNSGSVKKVVFTSSISTMTSKDRQGNWRDVVDESCRVCIDHVWKNKPTGWVYVLAKCLAEEAAFQFAKENGIDLVSVISPGVAGPFLTPNVPSSIQVLLSPLTGDPLWLPILAGVNLRMGSVPLVHVDDLSRAHIFLMDHDSAEGSYLCCSGSFRMAELMEYLIRRFPGSNLKRADEGEWDSIPVEICSKKLRDLGFNFKHRAMDVVHQTVEECLACEFVLAE